MADSDAAECPAMLGCTN